MTPNHLQEIKAREQVATPGPWEEKTNRHPQCNGEPWGWISGAAGNITWSGYVGKTNADFIAHARTDIPALVAEVQRLWKRLQQSHYGDDKIDELEESCNNLRFQIEQKDRRIATLETERDAAIALHKDCSAELSLMRKALELAAKSKVSSIQSSEDLCAYYVKKAQEQEENK